MSFYTDFSYSDLRVDREKLTDAETLQVQVDVTNTGAVPGKAVVQLYVRNMESTVRRPVRELKGFNKSALRPGETVTMTFTLDKRAFAYYEPKCKDWFVESGEFVIEIGQSSRDIRLSKSVQVEGTTQLAFDITQNTTIGQLMKHPKGAAFVAKMMPSGGESVNTAAVGEGSEKMVRNMMLEMPLGALVSYGRMTNEQLAGLIDTLNQ